MMKRSLHTSAQRPPATSPPRLPGMPVALAGMLLIATTYGMARFGVGLFGPVFEAERPELAGVLGWAGAAQFSAFALAALLAARLVGPRPRWGVALAGATATAGCLLVAVAAHPALFIAAVFLGGMGAGFSSPALVRIVDAAVSASSASTAQGVVNSGTAVGVVGAGMIAFALTDLVPAWVLMAALCVGSAALVWATGARTGALQPQRPAPGGSWPGRGGSSPSRVPLRSQPAAPLRWCGPSGR